MALEEEHQEQGRIQGEKSLSEAGEVAIEPGIPYTRRILRKGQELTKAKFERVKEAWWKNLRTQITTAIRAKQATEELKLAIERVW
jgi:hypothetical protein